MTDRQWDWDTLRDLLHSQQFAVLATHSGGQPYASLMAFAAADDLEHLVFATDRETHKYANLVADSRAALLVDRRPGSSSDVDTGIAVTAVGTVQEVSMDERDGVMDRYVSKHPALREFATSASCAFMKLRVARYTIVSGLGEVTELDPSESAHPGS